MAKIDTSKIKDAENELRDIINWVKVWNLEEIEVEGGAKKIADDVVQDLLKRLEKLARKISGLSAAI